MVKTLAKSLGEYKKASWMTIFLAVLEVVFEILIPLCMSDLIDLGIGRGAMDTVVRYGLLLLLFALLQLVTGFFAARFAAGASSGFSANLRQNMYDNVQTFAFSNIDKFSTSSIATRLTTDVTNVQNAYQMIIRMAIREPIMILFSMIVSFSINFDIALLFLILIPFLAVGLYFIIRAVNPVFKRVFRTYDDLNNIVQENLRE